MKIDNYCTDHNAIYLYHPQRELITLLVVGTKIQYKRTCESNTYTIGIIKSICCSNKDENCAKLIVDISKKNQSEIETITLKYDDNEAGGGYKINGSDFFVLNMDGIKPQACINLHFGVFDGYIMTDHRKHSILFDYCTFVKHERNGNIKVLNIHVGDIVTIVSELGRYRTTTTTGKCTSVHYGAPELVIDSSSDTKSCIKNIKLYSIKSIKIKRSIGDIMIQWLGLS